MSEQAPRQNDFSEKLIAAQRVEPSLRQRYEQEMNAMLEPALNRTRKVSFTLSLAVSAVMAVALTLAAVTTTSAPLAMRIGLSLGALYALGLRIADGNIVLIDQDFGLRIAEGAEDPGIDPRVQAQVVGIDDESAGRRHTAVAS